MTQRDLGWQSKVVLLLVLPFVGADVVLECRFWLVQEPRVAAWTLALSTLLGLVTWTVRAATPSAAATGAAITAALMFSTAPEPFDPWHTAVVPVLAVSLLAFTATRTGRARKVQLGTAEKRRGRSAAQVAANLGVAALAGGEAAKLWLLGTHWITHGLAPLFAASLAALAEAAADTVSSEIGQVFGGRPRMITSLTSVDPGRDGAVSVVGTGVGICAGALVAALGTMALRGDARFFWLSSAGAVFGLFFDSLLGAALEERGWLNNDAVNFLSTASAAAVTLALMVVAS
ncbi:MAG TPA: DUF92 domain-containing protein [Terracidiphilus sp.]|nr:DUF92 domain-containing protein [Terracidiphilus sp.]